MRYNKIDGLRGLTLISMIAYHACWDLVYLFNADMPWYQGQAGFLWQQSICWSFILLSGFSLGLGSHPVRRGITVSLAGLLVTFVTILFMPDDRVVFGVLTFLGCAMILCGLLRRWLERVPCLIGMIVSFLLFLIWYPINRGYIQIFLQPDSRHLLHLAPVSCHLPKTWYHGLVMTFFGFMDEDFFSTDYFSLLPWLFLFLTGFFICQVMEQYHLMVILQKRLIIPLEWLGRHSLAVYLLHQPLVYGMLLGMEALL